MKHGIDLWSIFNRILQAIAILSSVVVALALIYLVAARYWFNLPDTGLHTIALIAAVWMYMTGALLASGKDEHLTVDILVHNLKSPKVVAVHRLVVAVVTLFIIAMFCYWTWRMFVWGSKFSTTMPSLNIPIWVPQLAIALNAVGSLAFALRSVGRAIAGLKLVIR